MGLKFYDNFLRGGNIIEPSYDNFSRTTDTRSFALVTNGLVVNLDAGNVSSYPGSGTTWTDLSGNGINATLVNGVSYSSSNNGYMIFDGNDDYATLSSTSFVSGNSAFTMESWFRWSGNGSATEDIIFSYGIDDGQRGCPLIAIDGSNFFTFEFGSGAGSVKSISAISTNTWYHGVATYDGSNTRAYINGTLQNTTAFSTANIRLSGTNGTNAGIGCLYSSTAGNVFSSPRRYGTFNGFISSVRHYNRALSLSEVQQNFNALRGRYGI
jgi:hypothetical protein